MGRKLQWWEQELLEDQAAYEAWYKTTLEQQEQEEIEEKLNKSNRRIIMKEKDYLANIGRMVLPHIIKKLEHYAKKRFHENRQENQYDTDNYSWLRLPQQKEIMQECFADHEKEPDFNHIDILEAIVDGLTEKDCKDIYDTFWTFILSDCSDKELQMFRVSQIAKTYELD